MFDDSSKSIAEQANKEAKPDVFKCELCNFSSVWKNELLVHVARKHKNKRELENDEKYENTEHYWKNGRLGTVYQFYFE